MITKPLNAISANDITIAGGKGASLGEMLKAKMSVPAGFVVLTKAFDNFLDETKISQKIKKELRKLDKKNTTEVVAVVSDHIQTIILKTNIPNEMQEQILDEFRKLNTKFVAVRSSATAEDSDVAAWAGQLDSFLNTTEKNLLENIKKCWASLFSPHAILYSFKRGFSTSELSIAVVVQKMIESEKSGVAFSIHPVTENPSQIIIESGFGLGEAVVSGKIIPDTYVVSKKDYKIIDLNINKQTRGLYRKNAGGVFWKDISSFGGMQTLTNKQIVVLAKTVKKIENHYKKPQDIEWAVFNNNFYITQSRPITTLSSNIQKERFSHVLASKRIILAFLAMELWTRSKTIHYNSGPKNNPVFFHTKDNEYRVYYNKKYVEYYNNYDYLTNEKRFRFIFKKFLKINQELEKLLQKEDVGEAKKMLSAITIVFRYIDYFFFARIDRNMTIVSKERREEIAEIRMYSERILHDSFDFLLHYANDLLHQINKSDTRYKKSFFLADYILEKEFFTIVENDNKKEVYKVLQKAKKYAHTKNLVYHKNRIYVNKRAIDFIKDFVNIENSSTFYAQENKKGSLHGSTVIQGDVSGRAVIIKNWHEIDKINKAKNPVMLVCEDLTPEIISILDMNKVKSIIVSTGSILSHAAIIAREFNRPSAVNVQNIASLKDGTKIRLIARPNIANVYLV